MWDVDKISALRKDLLTARVIDLSDNVGPEMAVYVRVALSMLIAEGNPDIEVHITSNGGTYEVSVDIVDMLRHYPGKVTGKMFCMARSSGATILQGCDVRLSAKHARFLVHHLTDGDIRYDDERNPKRWAKIKAHHEREMEAMYEVFLRRANGKITRKKLIKLCKKDKDLSAEEALELGLIDGIIPDKQLEKK